MIRYDDTIAPARRRAFTDTSFPISDFPGASGELLSTQDSFWIETHLIKQAPFDKEAHHLEWNQTRKPRHRRCVSSPSDVVFPLCIGPVQVLTTESGINEGNHQTQSFSNTTNEGLLNDDLSDMEIPSANIITNICQSSLQVDLLNASFDTTSYDGVEMSKEFQHKIEIDKDQVYDAIINEKWSELELLCNECPENAAAENVIILHGQKSSCIPLHAACKQRPTASVVDTLITAYPRGVSYKESLLQTLPIHIACMYAASPGVVRALLAAFPGGVHTRDQDGNLPIHYASLFSSDEVVSILIQADPETCQLKNMKEKLPLHLACSRLSVNPLLVNALITAHPEGVKSKDYQGSLPIHVACSHRVDLDLIEILLHAFPRSIFERDNKGRTALMIAKSVLRLPGNHLVILALEDAERSTGGVILKTGEMIRSHLTSFAIGMRKKYRQDELIKAGYITAYQK